MNPVMKSPRKTAAFRPPNTRGMGGLFIQKCAATHASRRTPSFRAGIGELWNSQRIFVIVVLAVLFLSGCGVPRTAGPISREGAIPADAVKMSPETDAHPPVLHSGEFEEPVPLPSAVNTAGAEDSPFIPAGQDLLFFFFTPDVRVPPEKQLLDKVTGIYASSFEGGAWQPATRVVLQDPKKLSLDGCAFVNSDVIWFCSAREGYTGIHWFTAQLKGGRWQGWKNADFHSFMDVGELHMHGDELYYHSSRPGGKGGTDIWMSQRSAGSWQAPKNVEAVNTAENEGMPFVTKDGTQLWFNRWYQGTPAVFRSKLLDGAWQEPELIVSRFAGEPTLDAAGNLYFVHHYYNESRMIEADIYVARRK